MIKKIKKIKHLGVFSNYQWENNLPEFQKYNLIYGWNRVGKTTLSKFFLALENGILADYPQLEYEVETTSGNFKERQSLDRKIRVFNQNYVSNNIELLTCTAKAVFILGEENKAIMREIEEDEKILNGNPANPQDVGKIKKLKTQLELKEKKEKERGQKFTDIAKIIGENTSGVTPRNYRKPDAEKTFQFLAKKELLEEQEKTACSLILKQEEKPMIEELKILKIKDREIEEEKEALKVLKEAFIAGKLLSIRTVESIIIERFKKNNDISEWVEIGLALHEKYKSTKCEFCNQVLPENRIKELTNFFNEADQKLKADIEDLLEKLREIYSLIQEIKPIDKANLYKDLQINYESCMGKFEEEKSKILEKITELGKELKNKKSKTTESVSLEIDFDDEVFKKELNNLNENIRMHNKKTQNFQKERGEAQGKLEKHYLSSIYDEVKELEKIVEDSENKRKKLEIEIEDLEEKIRSNRSIISSSHKGCEKINEKLKTFLGSDEITFEVANEGGYLIKRNGAIAKNLSEAEKTAIAFVYFTIHLQDQNFDIKEGIIVIDDPISSLDSNSLFQAFAFLKNAVKESYQVFIFTHNFDFLRLLLGWLNYVGKSKYYMINNKFTGGDREAFIGKIDEALEKHESEYHYLVKKLLEFQSDGSIASVYNFPNIARKVLETFLMFRVPNNDQPYKKLESLKFDEDKKTAIYKFTNDQSHITGKGFDPSLVSETQKNVQYLLEMMQSVFPEHYNILELSLKNQRN